MKKMTAILLGYGLVWAIANMADAIDVMTGGARPAPRRLRVRRQLARTNAGRVDGLLR